MSYLGRKSGLAPLNTADIPSDSINTSHIIANAVTSAKIGVDVIVAEDIAANAITVSEIQDDAVTGDKLANDIAISTSGATALTGTLTVGVSDTGHDVVFYGATSGKYWMWDESIDKMTVTGLVGIENVLLVSDNVGIGSDATTPLGKLHVASGDSGGSANAGVDELVVEGSGNTGITILSGDTSNGAIWFAKSGNIGRGRIDFDQNDGSMSFATENIKRIIIDSSGNVGINTDAPDVHLSIQGSDTTAYASSLASGRNAGSDLLWIKNKATDAPYVGMYFSVASTANPEGRIAVTNEGGAGKRGDFTFALRNGDNNVVERMRITSTGRGVSQFTAKAWCNYNHYDDETRDSHNISTMDDVNEGLAQFNFDVDMDNANFTAFASASGSYSGATTASWQDLDANSPAVYNYSTTSIRTAAYKGGYRSFDWISLIAFGD